MTVPAAATPAVRTNSPLNSPLLLAGGGEETSVAKAAGARHVTFAAPVGPPDAVITLVRECDRVVVPMQPEPYGAVATWYERFEAVPEGAIQRLLEELRARTPEPA